jgi:hypothetical protein
MRGRWLPLVLGGLLLGLLGCGGDSAPKPLSAEEEKQFEQEREQERQKERRPPDGG